MDTEKCRVLLTVLHERSLSAAAEALGYTPSGVSRLVDSLERETGFPLLHRGRGGVSATRACQELLPLMRLGGSGQTSLVEYSEQNPAFFGVHEISLLL